MATHPNHVGSASQEVENPSAHVGVQSLSLEISVTGLIVLNVEL